MNIDLLDDKVQHKFSESALNYDVLASLHREIGRELYAKMNHVNDFDVIVDVGMGTGWMTNRLSHIFPDSKVIGLDFAQGMIDMSRKRDGEFTILQANAQRLPFKDQSIDVLASNLAYQWIDELESSFKECRRVLKNRHNLFLTLFGYNTFCELFEALSVAYGADKALPIERLYRYEDIAQAVKASGFSHSDVHVETIKVRYPDVMALIKWIKGLGANALKRDIFIGKDLLEKTTQYYEQRYKDKFGIYATFEVIWVIPHA